MAGADRKGGGSGKAGQSCIQQVDLETGEVLQGTVVLIPHKKKIELHGGWVAMAQPAMKAFSQIKSLEAQRVLWALLARLDYENYVLVNQKEIGDELGIKPPNLSRAMKLLAEHAILITGPKVGRSSTYRLNPSMGWKGSTTSHSKALNERMKAKGMTVIDGGKQD